MLGTPNRDRIAERREAIRREIVAAAWEVAREVGLAELTLRGVAARVGMQAPSLYSHFDSKHAIYDAMYAEAWAECREVMRSAGEATAPSPRTALRRGARVFFDYAVEDLARYQLMNQRIIPGFEPSPEAYRPAVELLDDLRAQLHAVGVTDARDMDLFVALIGGLANAQLANDPGGDRWARLVDRTVDMFADDVGLPAEPAPPSAAMSAAGAAAAPAVRKQS